MIGCCGDGMWKQHDAVVRQRPGTKWAGGNGSTVTSTALRKPDLAVKMGEEPQVRFRLRLSWRRREKEEKWWWSVRRPGVVSLTTPPSLPLASLFFGSVWATGTLVRDGPVEDSGDWSLSVRICNRSTMGQEAKGKQEL
jgi:hypothetical protein